MVSAIGMLEPGTAGRDEKVLRGQVPVQFGAPVLRAPVMWKLQRIKGDASLDAVHGRIAGQAVGQHIRKCVPCEQTALPLELEDERDRRSIGDGIVGAEGLAGECVATQRRLVLAAILQALQRCGGVAGRPACIRDDRAPIAAQTTELPLAGRDQRQFGTAGERNDRERPGVADDRRSLVEGAVPGMLLEIDQGGHELALLGSVRVAKRLGRELLPGVEPNVAEPDAERLVAKQQDGAVDVIRIDVRDDEQIDVLPAARCRGNALVHGRVGVDGTTVDQHSMRRCRRPVLDPDGVAVLGREHFDLEHKSDSNRRTQRSCQPR